MSNAAHVRAYLEAIGRGALDDDLAAYFAPDVVQFDFPNRLVPGGATRDLAAILEGARRGQGVLRSQRFEVDSLLEAGERVAVEAVWTGDLAVPIGETPAGGRMRARFAIFFELRDGLIVRQHNYDCFDPF
jgi:ketosteroid isomerase-like protein